MKMDCGLDIVLNGNIPNGSGLSSSASLEVLTGFYLRDLFGFDVTNVDPLVLINSMFRAFFPYIVFDRILVRLKLLLG